MSQEPSDEKGTTLIFPIPQTVAAYYETGALGSPLIFSTQCRLDGRLLVAQPERRITIDGTHLTVVKVLEARYDGFKNFYLNVHFGRLRHHLEKAGVSIPSGLIL
ncbi:MAG TPA: hypothetical protein VKP88_03580 [Candidatus Paceibacterota bacterium]|nr:hypothetical protein [Candidatus Paceibacterota bacterium]